jgi:hypothetical protein
MPKYQAAWWFIPPACACQRTGKGRQVQTSRCCFGWTVAIGTDASDQPSGKQGRSPSLTQSVESRLASLPLASRDLSTSLGPSRLAHALKLFLLEPRASVIAVHIIYNSTSPQLSSYPQLTLFSPPFTPNYARLPNYQYIGF